LNGLILELPLAQLQLLLKETQRLRRSFLVELDILTLQVLEVAPAGVPNVRAG
jgi:hypothetical protein